MVNSLSTLIDQVRVFISVSRRVEIVDGGDLFVDFVGDDYFSEGVLGYEKNKSIRRGNKK